MGECQEQAALAREAILEAEKLTPQVGAVEADLIKAALLHSDGYEPTARRSVDQPSQMLWPRCTTAAAAFGSIGDLQRRSSSERTRLSGPQVRFYVSMN